MLSAAKTLPGAASLAVVLLACRAPAADDTWLTDFEEAKAKAAKEGKHLLLEFTGSDWCPPCKMLHAQVFSKEAFTEQAAKHFVLVELDFPRYKKLSPELKKQNEEIRRRFRVRAYPTVLLTDAKENVYAQTGFQMGGPEAYVKHLEELRANKLAADKFFAKAEKAKGVKKARLLDKALGKLEQNRILQKYQHVIDDIKKLDSDGKGGLKVKYEAREKLGRRDYDGALKLIDGFVEEHSPEGEAKQEIFYLKGVVLHFKRDPKGRDAALQTALDAAPKTERGKEIAKLIEDL